MLHPKDVCPALIVSKTIENKDNQDISLDESKDNQNISVVGAKDMPPLSNMEIEDNQATTKHFIVILDFTAVQTSTMDQAQNSSTLAVNQTKLSGMESNSYPPMPCILQKCGNINTTRSPVKTDIKERECKNSTNFSTFPNRGDKSKGTNNKTFTIFDTFPEIENIVARISDYFSFPPRKISLPQKYHFPRKISLPQHQQNI